MNDKTNPSPDLPKGHVLVYSGTPFREDQSPLIVVSMEYIGEEAAIRQVILDECQSQRPPEIAES